MEVSPPPPRVQKVPCEFEWMSNMTIRIICSYNQSKLPVQTKEKDDKSSEAINNGSACSVLFLSMTTGLFPESRKFKSTRPVETIRINVTSHCSASVRVLSTKGRRKQENIVVEANMHPGRKKMFLENFESIFCFQDADFVSSTYVAWKRKRGITWDLGNTEETLTLNVFRMFPRLRTQATCLEDAEFASRKQKMF